MKTMAEQPRGLYKAAAIDDRGENAHSGQDPSVERHAVNS